MISIEDERTLIITRGDDTNDLNHIAFYLPIYNTVTEQEERYNFKPEDKITFIVSTKKGYTKTKVLVVEHTLREMGYFEETQYPELILTAEDSNSFDELNKKQTYFYEIDIISVKGNKVFFTEVKYRANNVHGSGLEVVTADKMRQMQFAAESYLKYAAKKLGSYDPVLSVAAVSGEDFEVDEWFSLV